jgi:hypothetical protein
MYESNGSNRVHVILYCLQVNSDIKMNENGGSKYVIVIGECLVEELTLGLFANLRHNDFPPLRQL